MVPDHFIRCSQDGRVGVCRGVTFGSALEHAEIVVSVSEGNHVFDVQFSAQVIDGVAFTAVAVMNIDPMQRRLIGNVAHFFLMNRDAGIGHQVRLVGDAGANSFYRLGAT